MRPHPHLYEINTWVWLKELSGKYSRQICLGDVPAQEWDDLKSKGFDCVWLMGVWQRSPAGRLIAVDHPQLRREYDRALPNWKPSDVVGSPYSIRAYIPDPNLGTWQDLDAVLEILHQRGMKLILDFVPNHTALDHEWVRSHPDYYIQGTVTDYERSPEDFLRVGMQDRVLYLARGKDPYFPAWTDTVQLNYFNEETRSALLHQIQSLAQHCDGVRCDMAMLVVNHIFRKTWEPFVGAHPYPETEFWVEAVSRIPEFIWIAEVYWDLEWELQQLGFQFTYDKRLYDRLRHSSAQEVNLHLTADVTYQSGLVRFLENHDEPRSAGIFKDEQLRACATLLATLPGMRLYHQGQLEGKRTRIPVQLAGQQEEPVNQAISVMYERLLSIADDDVFHVGEWTRLLVVADGDSTSENLIAYQWSWEKDFRMVVVNLSSVPSRGHVQVKTLLSKDPSASFRLLDQVTQRLYTFPPDALSQHGLLIQLPSYGAHVFSGRTNS